MWKRLSQKQLFKHPRITLLEDEVQLPDGTVTQYMTFAHTNDSVTILAQDGDKVLLSREYSYPVDDVLLQFPGGKAEPGEDQTDNAQRELQEETGYKAAKITPLGWYYVNNRRTKAKMYVVLATELTLSKKEGGDIEEDIESEWVAVADIDKMIQSGEIVNFSVLAAWSLYRASNSVKGLE